MRIRLTLILIAACCFAAVVGVVLARSGSEDGGEPRGGLAGSVRPPGARVPAATLRDQDGKALALASLRGPVIFTFVYSTCEDTCPLQVDQIRGALDTLGRDVPVIGVSVDPAGDTATRARRFLVERQMTGRMRFLLGREPELEPVWKAFGIQPQRGDLDHSAYTVLTHDGRQVTGYPADLLTSDDLAHDVDVSSRGEISPPPG